MFELKNKKAFTIIELIVVMAIIGILVLLAMPKFTGQTKQAKYTKLIANTKQLENASERYYMDKQDWPRLTDIPYSSSDITAFAQKIYDSTGKTITLDPDGSYYDVDYSKISKYIEVPDDKLNYIIQNPVGNIYALDDLSEDAKQRLQVGELILNKSSLSLNVGQFDTLIATVTPITASNKNVMWTSSNTNIAVVDSNGLVTSKASGSVTITATSEDGNYVATCNVTIIVPVQPQSFVYTGGVQSHTVSTTGTYKLEVWGAQGSNNGNMGNGGKGGYATGELTLTNGQVLNIYVGGVGTVTVRNTGGIGGWNGGGKSSGSVGGNNIYGSTQDTVFFAPASGGGATDIRVGGTLLSNRIIVAGGGGGAGVSGGDTGGAGGGLIGGNGGCPSVGKFYNGSGGTSVSGGLPGPHTNSGVGSLGYGGNGIAGYYMGAAGGGGGYYGGGAGSAVTTDVVGAGGGGGGSSYLGTLKNATTTAGLNSGNGKITITYIGQ